MKFIRFLKTDIKIINSYFLIILVLLILVCVGYSSYALFSISKTSNNIIELEVGEMTKLATETLISQTNNLNDSGLYTITHNADSTLQIGANEDITEYRYRGASPKNYVSFNNEVWRIIGVFPTEDENGNIENRIKLIRNESIGNNYWNTSSLNNWAEATLNTYLNGTYLSGLTSEAQSMIGSSKYYLGGYNDFTQTSQDMYSYERKISGSDYYYSTNPNSWVGKLALMYESDYGYASANCETKKLANTSTTDLRACNDTNWLYNIKVEEWLLPQRSSSGFIAFFVRSDGSVRNYHADSGQYAARPVLYLKPDIQIIDGDGTSSNPYILSTDGEVILATIDEFDFSITNFYISVTEGTYPLDKYCILSNDSDSSNCTWKDIPSNKFNTPYCCWNISIKKGDYTFYLFVKDENSNIVTKTYENSFTGLVEKCVC